MEENKNITVEKKRPRIHPERMTVDALEGAAALEQLCFAEPWSERALELLLGENAAGAVCLGAGKVLAYAGVLFVPGEGQITNVAVHPDHRGRGYGKAVLSLLLEEAMQRLS